MLVAFFRFFFLFCTNMNLSLLEPDCNWGDRASKRLRTNDADAWTHTRTHASLNEMNFVSLLALASDVVAILCVRQRGGEGGEAAGLRQHELERSYCCTSYVRMLTEMVKCVKAKLLLLILRTLPITVAYHTRLCLEWKLLDFFVGVFFRGKEGPPVFTITGQAFSTPGQGFLDHLCMRPEFIPIQHKSVMGVNSTTTKSCLNYFLHPWKHVQCITSRIIEAVFARAVFRGIHTTIVSLTKPIFPFHWLL